MIEGGLPFINVVVTLFVVALLLGVVCAVSQAWSALLARSITSALVSYLDRVRADDRHADPVRPRDRADR